MSGDEHRSIGAEIAALLRRVDELTSDVAALHADLEAHRISIRRELVTSRIAVAGADGFERIVLVAAPEHGSVAVNGRSAIAGSVVELFANDVDGRAHAGVALTEAGDVVSVLEVVEGDGARLWLGNDDPDDTSS